MWLFVWLLCGIAAAMVASSKGRSAGGWFFLGLILGPFGLLFALLAGKEGPAEGERKCPFCAEFIKREAIVCKHCGRDVPNENSLILNNHVNIGLSEATSCLKCKHENHISALSCENCGHRFEE